MPPFADVELLAAAPVTAQFRAAGVHTFAQAVAHTRSLPYGRISNGTDYQLVLSEQRGTCSSKHQLLLHLALENNRSDVQLIEVLFRMSEHNVPGVGVVLQHYGLPWMPEPHNYLRVNGVAVDATSEHLRIDLERDSIREREIDRSYTPALKQAALRQFFEQWRTTEPAAARYTTDELWQIREACIASISTH